MKKSNIGLAPGTLVYEGGKQKTDIHLITYTKSRPPQKKNVEVEDLKSISKGRAIYWIQVTDLGDMEKICALGELFHINHLVLEDILSEDQRPKMEIHDDFNFITLKSFVLDSRGVAGGHQVSLIVGENYVISFQEQRDDVFALLEGRSIAARNVFFEHKASYLAYVIMDFIVDQYFLVQGQLEERTERLAKSINDPGLIGKLHEKLYYLRTDILDFQKGTLPLLEVTNRFRKFFLCVDEGSSMKVYLDDLNDHVLQIQELIKTYTEILESLASLYFSLATDRTNKVVQVLTAITITFLPLTLIAGIYGMNFKSMPELEWSWGYGGVLGVMFLIATMILWFFKRKNWL